jgi:pimeloyl-ACP methyl ester carboxylesterase
MRAHDTQQQIPPGFEGTLTTVRGVRLRVATRGAGRDVLFLHGSPGSLEDFGPVGDALASSFRVTAYDRPGHGFSDDPGRYSLAYNAELAHALIEQLGLTRVIVVGHSYGGAAALALALRGTGSVAAYVVLDSALYSRIRDIKPFHKIISLPLVGKKLARAVPAKAVHKEIERRLHVEFKRAPSQAFVALRQQLWGTPKVTHALACEIAGEDAELKQQSPGYARIEAPIYLAAQRDQPERRAAAERLARDAPRATLLALVADSGHYLQYEAVEPVIAAVEKAAAET